MSPYPMDQLTNKLLLKIITNSVHEAGDAEAPSGDEVVKGGMRQLRLAGGNSQVYPWQPRTVIEESSNSHSHG